MTTVNDRRSAGRSGVKARLELAVDEFFEALGLSVMTTRDDAPFVSWVVRKPRN
jgi:hypothetical protein